MKSYKEFLDEMVITPGMTSGNFSIGSGSDSNYTPTHFSDIFRKDPPKFKDLKEGQEVSVRASDGK